VYGKRRARSSVDVGAGVAEITEGEVEAVLGVEGEGEGEGGEPVNTHLLARTSFASPAMTVGETPSQHPLNLTKFIK